MGLFRFLRILAAILCLMAAPGRAAEPLPERVLPALGADRTRVSVSGLAAGAFMAMQTHVAHSASIIGAGIVAGGPYHCTGGDAAYQPLCRGVAAVAPNARLLHWSALGLAAAGAIDPLEGLRRGRVYLFSGTADDTVSQDAMNAVQAFYGRAGVDDDNLVYVRNVRAGHAFLTPQATQACAATAPPFLNRCEVQGRTYDMAAAILEHLHGPLEPPAERSAGRLVGFDQRPFGDDFTGLAETGHLFIPSRCGPGTGCRLHVAFHPCAGAATAGKEGDGEDVGDAWATRAGYNRWAEANRIIVLYPRVRATAIPYNPGGCWDWWGYTGPAYATRNGAQIGAVMRMVERLAE